MPLLTRRAVLPAYAGMILQSMTSSFLVRGAPRVCGDDPPGVLDEMERMAVLPAYAGMILRGINPIDGRKQCSPRMRG